MRGAQHKGLVTKAEAEKYLWHLRPPWRDEFDHDHWWLNQGEDKEPVTLEAAMWEIFRRHPKTLSRREHNEAMVKLNSGSKKETDDDGTKLQLFLSTYCCKSWPDLQDATRGLWQVLLGEKFPPQRGFYPSPVNFLNYHRATGDRDEEWWLSRLVVHFHKKGRLIFAVDPFATGTGKLVEQFVKEWRQGKNPTNKGKSHLGQWLDVISSFESKELVRNSKEKQNDQLFCRYRRIIRRLIMPL